MRILSLLIFSVCLTFSALGQKPDTSYGEYDVRPYPATNVPVSPEAASFIALFEESNVGNLRVYSHYDDELPYEYPFKGKEIPESYYEMFAGTHRDLLEDDASYAYSIYSIKGNRAEHYLIRTPSDKGPNTIVLFDLNGEVMEPVQVLAYAYCKGDFCYQQDSFITDLDGDTDLDILTKFRRIEADDEETLVKNDIVYLQEDDGSFEMVLDNELRIDKDAYNMKAIEFEE
ncbi:hypothetical protein [Phaeodactylibacter xiamenensis]|jgi:hypothetical protein|uniref:hypothetical protein n=1 Tax=Phaeodactylibacter xiamenensis TaxID=1524460 RepID=UPI0024A7C29B|nr:hypothetical protein [Phaeodactylibacter xiamenensis]